MHYIFHLKNKHDIIAILAIFCLVVKGNVSESFEAVLCYIAPAGGTWCLRRVLGPSGPYPVDLGPMKTSNLVSHGHIRGVCFF